MSTTYHATRADLEFLLGEVLDLDGLLALPGCAHADRDIVMSVLAEGARFAEQVLSPTNGAGDASPARLVDGRVEFGPGFDAAWSQYVADGWLGLDLPQSIGGQGLPRVVQAAFAEMTNGANLAFSMLPVTVRAAARLLLAHGGDALVAQYGPALVDGSCAATIAITESQAGSDVGRTQTLATPQADGGYRLDGTKIFISNGDHELASNIAHMVLARTPGATPGTRGISLFLVPKFIDGPMGRERNGVRVVRLEHKMGLKGSPTCVLAFENARGLRIGPEGRGLQQMFAMVNTMRLEVAVQGAGVAGAATQRAIRYALDRPQGGAPAGPAIPIAAHPDVRRMLLTMIARTDAVRALTLEAALALDVAEHAPDEADRARAAGLAQWLLPICKAWGTDTGLEVANLAVQVFGGHGYVVDSGVEQYVRDVRVACIYEGTNGIQAIDLLARKLVGDSGLRAREWIARIRADLAATAGDAELALLHARVAAAVDTFEQVSLQLLERAGGGLAALEGGAVPYLRLAGLVGGGWMWLRMAAAARSASPLHRQKRRAAEFYARMLLPEAALLADQAREAGFLAAGLEFEEWMAGA
jgi:alkylation response protein AidB-like acyl-CoA dehydrogenase